MIQQTEREVINRDIVRMLTDGKPHKEIAQEMGVSCGWVVNVARDNNLVRRPKEVSRLVEGNSLEEIRKANPFKVGDKVIVKDKNGSDTYKSYKCTEEYITDWIIFARGENGRMYTASFPAIGMDSNLIRKVG